MMLLTEIRNRARFIVGPLFGLVAVGYFAYHAVQGERGLIAWSEIRAELARSNATLAKLEARRGRLERDVGLLSPQGLDPDMLEERARIMLNFGYPDETMILTGNPAPNPAPAK